MDHRRRFVHRTMTWIEKLERDSRCGPEPNHSLHVCRDGWQKYWSRHRNDSTKVVVNAWGRLCAEHRLVRRDRNVPAGILAPTPDRLFPPQIKNKKGQYAQHDQRKNASTGFAWAHRCIPLAFIPNTCIVVYAHHPIDQQHDIKSGKGRYQRAHRLFSCP